MALPVPSPAQRFVGHDGLISREWLQFLLLLARQIGAGSAPVNAGYIVATPDAVLTNERVATSSVTIEVDLTTAGLIRWNLIGGAGASWIPLSAGVEPLAFISDGMGNPILVAYP
jgi:hypothetical protein